MDTPVQAVAAGYPPEALLDGQILDLPDWLWDFLPVAIYICDRDGVIVRFNRHAAELWGRAPKLGDPAECFCGSHRLYRLDGGPLPHAECPTAQVLHTGIAIRGQEIVIERPDGSRAVALVNVEPLKGGAGAIQGAVSCFQDITERKRVEAGLRNSHDLLGALPAAVYTTDAEGRITYYNQAAVDLWGQRPERGKSGWCGSWRLYWPDGRPMAHDECPMALALKERRPVRGMEAVAERPHGTRVPFVSYPTPLFDDSGVLTGAVNMLVDITDRKRAEEAAQRLAAIVECSTDAIASKDLNGIITSWNQGAERLFGYKPGEVIGKPITILIPPERHEEEPGILARIRRGERVDHYETVRRRKDGSLVDISLTVSPITGADGTIIGASKIARDITERKRAEEQQTLLLREMRHRVTNLLTIASSMVGLSARSAQTVEELAEAVRGRLLALMRAHELTRPGLIDAEETISQETTLDALCQAIFAPYADLERSEIDGCVVIDGPEVRIGGSAATSFALILHEFATNAAKYGALSSPAGRIHIGWTVENDGLRLTWQEHGGPSLIGPPKYEGFGSLLTRQAVTGQFDGQLAHEWRPEGLMICLSATMERLTE